jgi:surfeit locus 1 family protein
MPSIIPKPPRTLTLNQARWRFAVITVAAVLGVVVTLMLGRWQLQRAELKETLQLRQQQQAQLAPLGFSVLNQTDANLIDRQATFNGVWLPEHTVLLDNRTMNQRSGFYVLTPLKETTTGRVVLVQRGWVARDFQARESIPAFDTPTGPVTVTGRIASGPGQTWALGDAKAVAETGRIRQNLNLDAFRASTALSLWGHMLVQNTAALPADGLLRDWPAPASGVEKHHGYAFQWFALAALILGLYLWFQALPRLRSKR